MRNYLTKVSTLKCMSSTDVVNYSYTCITTYNDHYRRNGPMHAPLVTERYYIMPETCRRNYKKYAPLITDATTLCMHHFSQAKLHYVKCIRTVVTSVSSSV